MLHDLAIQDIDGYSGPRIKLNTSGIWKSMTNIVSNLKP